MKILIDGRSITSQTSGIGRYIYHLIEGYIKEYGYDKVQVILNTPIKEFPYKYILCPYQRHSFWGTICFSIFLNKLDYDVLHSGDMTGTFWHKKQKKHIVTIHDLMFLVVPGFFKLPFMKRQCRKIKNYLFFYTILQKADLRISVSQTTRLDLQKYYSLDSIVIREGVNKIKKYNNTFQPYKDLNKNSFFLYVGLGAPHKNIQFMIDAFLSANTDKKLVICGKGHDPIINEKIIYTGWVQDEELDFLYQNCAAFIFPSLYEGFGLPILEALSYHCKVFSSNAGALGEFSSQYVHFFNPQKVEELTTLIEKCDSLHTDIEGINQYLSYYNWEKIWNDYHRDYNIYKIWTNKQKIK